MRRNNRKGFTIVELVIVIAVIAILAAVLIPTFASLIKKANMSVDMQMVRQMNTILATEETVDGKPGTAAEAKQILIDNGVTDFIPSETLNVYYWVGSENRVMLWAWESDDDKAAGDGVGSGKVTYPEDLAKKYKDVSIASVDWADLSIDYAVIMIEPEGEQTIVEALLDALSEVDAASEVFFALPANSTLSLTQEQIWAFSDSLEAASGVGKHISIDLNGSTIDLPNSTHGIDVPDSGSLELTNGTWNFVNSSWDDSGFQVGVGSSLILRNMTMNMQGHTGIAPLDDASEIIIDNTTLNCDAYFGISTNGMTSRVVQILINNSTINNTVNGGGVGINVNATADVYINNSKVAGEAHALLVRAGHVEVTNTTLETIATAAGIYKYDSFTHFNKVPKINGNYVEGASATYTWSQANACPGAVLVAGDYAREAESYPGDVNVVLTNVTMKSANISEVPYCLVAAKLTKNVTLTYDANTNITDVIMYNYMIPQYFGSITVNGESKTIS